MNHKKASTLATLTLLMILSTAITSSLSDTRLTIDPGHDWAPSTTQTSEGTIWIVWHSDRTGNREVFYATYNGVSWSDQKPLTTNPNVDGQPDITQTKDGNIWVVWTSNRNGNFDLFYKKGPNETKLRESTETPLTTHPSDDTRPSIIQSGDGKIWIVWQSRRAGNDDIFYMTSSDNGASWSAQKPLTTDPSDDRHPSIIQAADGTIWVVWSSFRTGNFDIFYTTSIDNGASWSAQKPLTTNPLSDIYPSIMQSKDGNIWFAWQSEGIIYDEIYYRIYNGPLWSPENALTLNNVDNIMPSLMQAMDGKIWLAWTLIENANYDIYYKFVIIDVAVTKVTVSKTMVYQGKAIDINAEIKNEGTASATLNATAYNNSTAIGTRTVISNPTKLPLLLTFTWNTTGVPYGYYTISATAKTALGETNLADNSYTDGKVMVTIPGDIDGDRLVYIKDAAILNANWGARFTPSNPYYNPNADINGDGKAYIQDAAMINAHWRQSW